MFNYSRVLLIWTKWNQTLSGPSKQKSGLNGMMFFFNLLINIFQKILYVFIQIQNLLIYNFTLRIIIVLIKTTISL